MPPEHTSKHDRLISAAVQKLGQATVDGLLELELNYEDLVAAVYAELIQTGMEEPEKYFREQGIE